jgi:hypothetical protein
MAISKVSLQGWGVVLGVLIFVGCGRDPQGRFVGEVNQGIQEANEGRHGELEEKLSQALQGRVRSEGWEPRAALVVAGKKDREEGAKYRLSDVPKFEGSYAEAEIIRISGGKEKRVIVPFVLEEGRWKVGAAYRDGRAWEEPDF